MVLNDVARFIASHIDEVIVQVPRVPRHGQTEIVLIFLGLWGAMKWVVAVFALSFLTRSFTVKVFKFIGLLCFIIGVLAAYSWTAGVGMSAMLRFVLSLFCGAVAILAYRVLSRSQMKSASINKTH